MSVTTNATSAPFKFSATAQVSALLWSLIMVIEDYLLGLKTNNCWNLSFNVKETPEEKSQQLKERLNRLFEANERRCSRGVLYGSDLLQACTLSLEPVQFAQTAGAWRWVGRENCFRAQRTPTAATSTLQASLKTVEDRLVASNSLIKRYCTSVWGPSFGLNGQKNTI